MTLRKRLSLIAAASVAVAVLSAVVICYMVVRSQLRDQVDNALRNQESVVGQLRHIPMQSSLPGPPASAGGPAQYYEVVFAGGQIDPDQSNVSLPLTPEVQRIAASGSGSFLGDVDVGNTHYRVLGIGINVQQGFGQSQTAALLLARPLNGVDSILSSLRLILALVLLGGIAVAAILGRLAARRVLAPLGEVAQAVQHIGETDDLSRRIRVHADDEVGQLAIRFNAMLVRLESSRSELDESVRAQRQLVADASHELRTPVTSLRTNIEVLLANGDLDPEDRRRLLTDVVEQSEELSALVGDLIELARGDQPGPESDEVRLDGIAAESLARARRNAPEVRFEAVLEPTLIDGVPERLSRALNNLLDNATRHSPPASAVEVRVGPAGVEVRDHGPGVNPDDLPYVFDRFYRGANSRGRQGSGLGLAIVRQVAEQHGGRVSVHNAPDGGAVFVLALPAVTAPPDAPALCPSPGEALEII
jgi:two-component system sensor histidine kinase MprB